MNNLTINTNLSSLLVQHSLNKSTNTLNLAIERMTTGYKINSAKDDAAGYAVASRMMVDLSSYDVAKNNAGMGLSLLETANKSMDLISEHLQRIRDLVTEASNGTYDTDSLNAIQAEINARQSEIDRLISSTEYNGIRLFEPTEGITGSFLVDVVQLSADEATDQGYTLVTNAQELKDALDNNEDICLMNDIDLSGWITASNMYSGRLNGNGHVLNNLTSTLIKWAGLADIKNLGLENVNVTNGYRGGIDRL